MGVCLYVFKNIHSIAVMARKRKVSESDFFDSSNSSDSESNSQTPYKRPQARNAANARERARMRVLSKVSVNHHYD